jgi:undecaprenyl-diphosphatase
LKQADQPQDRRRIHRRLLRAEYAYGAGLAAFAVLAILAHIYAYFGWDVRISSQVQSIPGIYGIMRDVSRLGDKWVPWVLAAVTILLFIYFRLRNEAWGLLLSVAGGEALNRLVKILIARPRPTANLVTILQVESSESFPSGHVTFYVCFFGFLFFVAYARLRKGSLTRRAAMTLCALPVLLIGPSRVYLGAHWPSDTLGAYLFAGLWLALSIHLYRRWQHAEAHSTRTFKA